MEIDRDFLNGFLAAHLPKLRAFARLRMPKELRQRESESDVMQLAFVQVLARAPEVEFRGEPALLSWLYGAIENAVRDLLKRHREKCRDLEREVHAEGSELLGSYATFCTPSRVLSAREDIARIEDAMDALSPSQREVVMLSCLVGLPHEAIAEQTGLSTESVRAQLCRGLARLAVLVDVPRRGK